MIFYPQKLEGRYLKVDNDVEVRYTRTGNIIRYSIQSHRNRYNCIKLLPDGQYMDTRTGEVKDRKFTAKTRYDNIKNVRKSMQDGRDFINANVFDLNRTAWITFTYAENMRDPKRLQKDFEHFNENYRKQVGNYEYITAVEPQRRGAFHLHSFFIFDHDITQALDYRRIIHTWGKGRVEVQYMYGDVDNLGAYLSAYLCNLDLNEKAQTLGYHDLNVVACERTGKMYEKGQRLGMYPKGMKIFRRSKGIIKPDTEWIEIREAEKRIKALAATRTFEQYSEQEIQSKTGTYTNIIYNQYFNINPRENQQSD